MTSIFRLLFALAIYYKPCGEGQRQLISLSRLCFVTCCLLLLGVTFSHAQPVVPDSDPVVVLKAGQLQFLRDASQSMTLDDAKAAFAKGRFTPLSGNLGLGYVPDAVWLHLSVRQDQPAARWLEVMPPYLDDIRLFHIAPDGHISERRGGDRLPQASKEEDYRGHLFKLDLQPGQHDLFIRLKTTSTMAVPALPATTARRTPSASQRSMVWH